jgi:hypothetical protein
MFRLIALIFSLPWPVLVLLAGGLFWMGYDAQQKAVAFEAEKVQALADGQPVAVPLDDYDAEVRHPAGEVHVTAWVNPAYNYELTKQKKGADTVRRMFVLFGPGDALDSRVARGIVLIRPEQVDAFLELMIAQMTGEFDGRLLFNLNGARGGTADIADMVDDALDEQGLMKAGDFLVVEPYFQGREAALAPDPDAGTVSMQIFGVLGGGLLLIAARNALSRRKVPERKRSLAEVEIPPVGAPIAFYAQPQPQRQAAGDTPPPPPPVDGTWSPLEAVRARQAARDGVAPAPVGFRAGRDSFASEARAERYADRSAGRKRGMRAPVAVAGALGLYLVMYLVFGQIALPTTMNSISENGVVADVLKQTFGFDPEAEIAEAEEAGLPGTDEAAVPADAPLGQSSEAAVLVQDEAAIAAGAVAPLGVPSDVAADGGAAPDAASTAPQPEEIAGMSQPLPQIGDTPAPKDQVQEDIASGVPPAEAIRRAIVAEFPEEETGPVFLSPGGEEPVAEVGLGQRLRDLITKGLGGIMPVPDAGSVQVSGSAGAELLMPPSLALPLPLPLLIAVVAAGLAGLLLMGMAVRLMLSRRAAGPGVGGQTRSDPWDRLSDRLR